jgi:Zn-dependent protease with chaperone function
MKKLTIVFPAIAFLVLLSIPSHAEVQQPRNVPLAAQQGSDGSAATPGSTPAAAAPSERIVTSYTLPPETYKKARDLSRIRFRFEIISFVYGLVVLWLALSWRLAPTFRNWAESISSKRFLQGIVFSPLLILATDVLSLPTGIYDNWVERKYGLSVQRWGSWSWDWAKGELISVIIGSLLITLLYAVIRKSPRRWWFYFWLVTIPLLVIGIFLQPLIIDPMFHKFVPLAEKDPRLTASLQQLVEHSGQNIPPERMFWMGAAEKSTELNAYVTGFGSSKRIVVWDTTIAKMNTPQIVFVTGHEMGHYVLRHIPKLIVLNSLALLILFYLGYHSIGWVLAQGGGKWAIRGLDDWASLPVLLLLLGIFSFVSNPITNVISRHYEHQADQYGLEVTHALTPGSGQVAAQAFQILGEVDLSDPEPNPLNIFLFYSHPAIPDRIRFALTYDPWSDGGSGEFVH